MPALPETHYAKSGDVNIAYQVSGQGPRDLVLVPGFVSHLDFDWEEPRHGRMLERLGSFSRLIRFDKRGTGLSDRPGGLPDLETRMDDVRAVMDAVGSERAVLFGYSEGGPHVDPVCRHLPARAPSRSCSTAPTPSARDPDADYPWAPTWEQRQADGAPRSSARGRTTPTWARWRPTPTRQLARLVARPGESVGQPRRGARSDPDEQPDRRARVLPRSARADARAAPRRRPRLESRTKGRYIADHIPGARFVLLEGEDHAPFIDPDQIVDDIEEFVTGVVPAP